MGRLSRTGSPCTAVVLELTLQPNVMCFWHRVSPPSPPPAHTHTHTHTRCCRCTVVRFYEVAKALSETAFITSNQLVILSLEMHCTILQQRSLASMLVERFGHQLLSVRFTLVLTLPIALHVEI